MTDVNTVYGSFPNVAISVGANGITTEGACKLNEASVSVVPMRESCNSLDSPPRVLEVGSLSSGSLANVLRSNKSVSMQKIANDDLTRRAVCVVSCCPWNSAMTDTFRSLRTRLEIRA